MCMIGGSIFSTFSTKSDIFFPAFTAT
jgi:hypothetical protein